MGLVTRRNLLGFSSGMIGVGLQAQFSQPAQANVSKIPYEQLTPDLARQRLVAGNQRFVQKKRENPNQTLARLQEVALGQKPFAAILGCADSRVPTEIIFDQGLGDLFVCRVAGNISSPEEIGSLEFGSAVLGAKIIMVLGHGNCGAVQATLDNAEVPGKIGNILNAIRPALAELPQPPATTLEQATIANVRYQMSRLKGSPVLQELVQKKQMMIVGGYYEIQTGRVQLID